MKRYLLLLMCWMFPAAAEAYVFSDIPFTGLHAEKTDNPGYGVWNPYSSTSYMGGSAGTNSRGMAFQFTLSDPVDIDYLAVNARARSYYSSEVEKLSFDFKIYSGSLPYRDTPLYTPDFNHLVASSPADFQDNGPDDRQYTDYLIPLDKTLAPGTYWLSREREEPGGGLIVEDISTRFAKVHTPEPASLILFGGGLLGVVVSRSRKKYIKLPL